VDQIRLTWLLIRDPRVPLWTKVIPFVGLAYIISPIDIIPDVLLGLGQLDDLGILLGGMRLFEAVVPDYIVVEHRAEIARSYKPLETINTSNYRVSRKSEEKVKRS